jgi:hypothetical protein
MNKDEFMKEFNAKYKCKYTLLTDYIDENTKVTIRHNLCGYEYQLLPKELLKTKHRCKCFKQKVGEFFIEKFLIYNNFNYAAQYSIKDCKYKKTLRFDFAIFNQYNKLKFLIEFDGDFHKKNPYDSESLEKQKIRDKTKDKFCDEKKIPLERIEYIKLNELDEVLTNIFIKYNLVENDEDTKFDIYKYEDEEGNIMAEVDGLVKRNNKIYDIVGDFLDKYDVIVKRKYIIPKCRDKKPLPFGFALFNPDNNELITLIDPICESHNKITYKIKDLENIVYHDAKKDDFCNKNNINLERIYYWDFDCIFDNLQVIMKKYNIQYIPE